MDQSASDRLIPTTVITGFLGSGKTTLLNALIKHPALADTAVLVDARGNVSEGPGFNVFCVRGSTVISPGGTVLEGVTRRTVAELCTALGLEFELGPLRPDELREADEVFLSSTAGGVTTSTVTVPLVAALGLGLAENVPGRPMPSYDASSSRHHGSSSAAPTTWSVTSRGGVAPRSSGSGSGKSLSRA